MKSQAVDRSIFQFWKLLPIGLWPFGTRIKFPLHKYSENAWVCYLPRQSTARDLQYKEFLNAVPHILFFLTISKFHFP